MRVTLVLATPILAATLLLCLPAQARRAATAEPTKVVEPTGTWTSGTQPERDCGRARRKFWRPQEGWIVRTVVTCR